MMDISHYLRFSEATDRHHSPECKEMREKLAFPESAPYLSHPLEPDNLRPFCKNVSG